ncbi:hypothetical protein SAZ11_06095 [Streptomyces sp. FXJ1.4098]|nr:hypothetical protein [Streptomyces sp. FXJ1.4098]
MPPETAAARSTKAASRAWSGVGKTRPTISPTPSSVSGSRRIAVERDWAAISASAPGAVGSASVRWASTTSSGRSSARRSRKSIQRSDRSSHQWASSRTSTSGPRAVRLTVSQ